MECLSSFATDHFSCAPVWDRSSLVIFSRDLPKAELSLLKLLPQPIGELFLSYADYWAGLDEDYHTTRIGEMSSLRKVAFQRVSVFRILLWLPRFWCIWYQNCRDLLLLWKQRNISSKGCLKVFLSAELVKEPSVWITPVPFLRILESFFSKVKIFVRWIWLRSKSLG